MQKGKSQNLYKKAKRIIPGGTQLLSKRPEMFLPDFWPAYYQKAKGCEVQDLDGKRYLDMVYMGLGACILGYADKDINKAVKKAISLGSISTLNCYEEVELAQVLCQLHPWAEQVRYARTGGEAMVIAVRIARAKTERDLLLFCGYHGWHDWYLSANLADDEALDGHLLPGLEPKGVPRALKGTAIPFEYNDTEKFLSLVKKYKDKIAAVVMEPIRNYYPKKGFLEKIKEVTKKLAAVLIFDEVSCGWRLNTGGAHLKFGVYPDIAVFGKAMSNGYPMAAVIGRKKVMEVVQESFISSTYWTERVGPAAALACIKKMQRLNLPRYLKKIGKQVQKIWDESAKRHGLKIKISGIYPLSHFQFEHNEPLVLKTLFTQLMLEKGFLAANTFYACYAHKETHLKRYAQVVDQSFAVIARAVKEGKPKKYLKGPVCHAGFRRLT